MTGETLQTVLKSIRELSFDRFVTPTFFIAHRTKDSSWTLQVTSTDLLIKSGVTTMLDITLSSVSTLQDLLTAIVNAALPIDVIYSGSFIPSEPVSSIVPMAVSTLDLYRPLFRSYYFSDSYITQYFTQYLAIVMLRNPDTFITTPLVWDDEFADPTFNVYRRLHFTLWVAYQVVGQRRLYEMAAQSFMQSSQGGSPDLINGLSYVDSANFSIFGPGNAMNVKIGDVFNLSEDENTASGVYDSGTIPAGMLPPWALGSDNTLMDYYSLFYRLQLWLRDTLEQKTGDYSLRKDTVMTGKIFLDPRDSHNYFAFFDSYPWVFSPYLRSSQGGSPMQSLT